MLCVVCMCTSLFTWQHSPWVGLVRVGRLSSYTLHWSGRIEDCVVLDAILSAGYKPKVIVVKINPSIPPPLKFSIINKALKTNEEDTGPKFDSEGVRQPEKPKSNKTERFYWKGGPYYSCSLSYASHVAAKYHYVALQLDWAFAVYIDEQYLSAFNNVLTDDWSVYWNGFYGRTDRFKCIGFRTTYAHGDPFNEAQMAINYPEVEQWFFELNPSERKRKVAEFMDSVQHTLKYSLSY